MAIAYDRRGTGPQVLLLHPLGADRRMWDSIAERLSGRREVIALDLPGFGESASLSGESPTPRALATAVARQLESIGVSRPHAVGNSLGGGWVWSSG